MGVAVGVAVGLDVGLGVGLAGGSKMQQKYWARLLWGPLLLLLLRRRLSFNPLIEPNYQP